MSNERFLYLQGRVSLALIDSITGLPGRFTYVGDVSALTPKFSVDKIQHFESNTGQLGLAASFDGKKTNSIDGTFHKIDADNLAIFTRGGVTQTAAGTVTTEVLPDGLVAGDIVYLANPGASDIVITDNADMPVVVDTNYAVEDANFSRLRVIDPGVLAQPFKVAYAFAARREVAMFKAAQQYYALRLEGVDLANGNAPIMVDFYKVAPSVVQQLDLIATGNDTSGMQVTSDILQDSSKPATGALGQYGKVSYIGVTA